MAFQLPLTRKSNAQPAAAPVWHPNFRNFERLPDTKVVRTAFFISMGAIAVTAGLLLWAGTREYHLHVLSQQIAEAQARIDSKTKQNNEALRLSKVFADEEKKLSEAANFTGTPIRLTELLIQLGQTLPKEISLEIADYRLTPSADSTKPSSELMVTLRGSARGTADEASGAASSYIELLRTHPSFAAAFDTVELTNINRDARTGFLIFEVILRVKPDGKGKNS